MSEKTFYNRIRYRLRDGAGGDAASVLELAVDGDWVWETGVKASVFTARIAYTEFEKLGGNYDRFGQLEFFFEFDPDGREEDGSAAKPDLALLGWRIVDLKPLGYQWVEAIGAFRHSEYLIAFADARDLFAHPWGGALTDGELNKEPISKDGKTDANGRKVVGVRAMVNLCLAAMQLNVPVDAGLTDALPPVLNVNWRGNPAPDELDKVLADTDFVFVVKADGTCAIDKRGKGRIPEAPAGRQILTADYPGIDRRGRAVVFSSAPLASVETRVFTLDDGLEWVILDDDGKFRTLGEAHLLKNLKPIEVVMKNFEPIAEKYRDRVRTYLYRAVRINVDAYGPQEIMRYGYDVKTGQYTGIEAQAKAVRVLFKGTDLLLMPKDFVDVPVLDLVGNGRVLVLAMTLAKLDQGQRFGYPTEGLSPLEKKDLRVTCARETYDPNDDGTWRPRFFTIGYKRELGKLVKLSKDEVATLVAGEAGYISMPELRVYSLAGDNSNQAQVEVLALAAAQRYIGRSGNDPAVVSAAGYVKAELSGQVNQVTFTCASPAPMTTWKVNTWFFPHERAVVTRKYGKAGGEAADAPFPKATATADKRTAEGIAGGLQPAVPIGPDVPAPPQSPVLYGRIKSTGSCKYFAIVNRCDLSGEIASDKPVTVYPNPAGHGQGFSYVEGEVVAYLPDGDDPTIGWDVGAYKAVSVRHVATDKNSPQVPDLNTLQLYNGDFYVKTSSDCGNDQNVAGVYWRGLVVKRYAGIGGPLGAPNTASSEGVKVLDLDAGNVPTGTPGVNYVDLPFNVTGGSTTANVPSIGGADVTDESGPLEAKVTVRAKLGVVVSSIGDLTITCNEDGTITGTLNYATARAVVP